MTDRLMPARRQVLWRLRPKAYSKNRTKRRRPWGLTTSSWATFRAWSSSCCSATSCLRQRFSSSSARRWLASPIVKLWNLDFFRYKVCSLNPCSRHRCATFLPDSASFRKRMICSSLSQLHHLGLVFLRELPSLSLRHDTLLPHFRAIVHVYETGAGSSALRYHRPP